jgi:hydrogenase nickel incorporation protein HypA/HybF
MGAAPPTKESLLHEMGITQGILAASFDAATDVGATRITEIRVSVGELTEIVDVALQFAFEALTPGTMAEGATLQITHVPARSRCLQCGLEYEHDRFQMVCPECNSFGVELLQGREMRIDSIEADEEPPASASAESDAAGVVEADAPCSETTQTGE